MSDGYYFIAGGMQQSECTNGQPPPVLDLMIESMHWLDDNLLIVTTSNDELRVLYT